MTAHSIGVVPSYFPAADADGAAPSPTIATITLATISVLIGLFSSRTSVLLEGVGRAPNRRANSRGAPVSRGTPSVGGFGGPSRGPPTS